jgi:hypothetical protein
VRNNFHHLKLRAARPPTLSHFNPASRRSPCIGTLVRLSFPPHSPTDLLNPCSAPLAASGKFVTYYVTNLASETGVRSARNTAGRTGPPADPAIGAAIAALAVVTYYVTNFFPHLR